jgi:hypothetical protein
MMLGDLLASARSSASALEGWLAAADPELDAQLAAAAEREGVSPARYARAAVATFAQEADGEAWATLTSRLSDSADPGAECLRFMLRRRLHAAGA